MRGAERAVVVGIVVAVAAVLRAGYVVSARVLHPLRADAGQYAAYAENLVERGVYSLATAAPYAPDSFRSPGYPLFLAACRLIGGNDWQQVAIWLQVGLGTATVFAAYALARHLAGFWPAASAASLTALSPHLVVSTGYVLTECLSAACVAGGLALLVGAGSRWRLAAGGALLGAAVLVNETLLFLPLAIAVASWGSDRRRAIAVLLVALLPFAAWCARNASQPLVRTGGERATASISHGSYPGMVYKSAARFGFPYHEDPEQPAFGSSWQMLGEVLARRVAERPMCYARWYLLEKPLWLWGWNVVQGRDVYVYEVANSPYERHAAMAATHALMRWLHLPVMLLAAAGAVWAVWRRRSPPWGRFALGCAALAGTLAYVLVIPDPRYLQPIRPVLFALSAATAAAVVAGWAARQPRVEAGAAPVRPPA